MMSNVLTEDTQAIILLCGFFGKDRSYKPLTLKEYSSLVSWLVREEMRPGDLLGKGHLDEATLAAGIDRQRLEYLLGRGVQLGFAVEEWQRNGIWIISRSDTDYPERYKKHLKDKSPPLLFGVGDRYLLKGGGLGMVGSRNVDEEGEAFCRQVSELCACNQMPVVSGGARGVDRISMNAALEAGGVVIGIVAENLLKKSVERMNRQAIADGRLLLLSPYHPNARFTVGGAMGRNKLIYAMADYGLVVRADLGKGGTWTGATEELKRDNPKPVFVRTGNNVTPGNIKLLELGAVAWPESVTKENLKERLAEVAARIKPKKTIKQPGLFDALVQPEEPVKKIQPDGETEAVKNEPENIERFPEKMPDTAYDILLPTICKLLATPLSSDELAGLLDVKKSQAQAWLKKATDKGDVIKLTRPVRYQDRKAATSRPRVTTGDRNPAVSIHGS
ncbi:MAG: DNA-processing protein DprA [Thermodesulfobacteriota bacterium]|nr:DNA-processing protein DprA [Thermodesulfobacteriota bacterium]